MIFNILLLIWLMIHFNPSTYWLVAFWMSIVICILLRTDEKKGGK